MEEQVKMVRPQWKRFPHANGKFAFEFDALSGQIRCVDRGGTVVYDLAAEIEQARRQVNGTIDVVANVPS